MLQDLFVDESVRGQGVARALITQVAQVARERGAPRLYWLTHHTNTRARHLYDRVASHQGFIRYGTRWADVFTSFRPVAPVEYAQSAT